MPTAVRPGLIAFALLTLTAAANADDWPQWLGPQRDGVWREPGIVEKFPEGGPKVLWRVPVGGGYAGPAVADGRVYVTDRVLPEGTRNPANAFARTEIPGTERVLCLDEKTGKEIWKHEYDCPYRISYASGPRATPLVAGGKVYTLGAMGHLLCLDAASGKVVWSKYFPKDYEATPPMWGFAGHPLLDGDRLVCLVGGPGSVAVAFHKDTGAEVWKALSAKEPGYCPPTVVTLGGKRQVIVWHPQAVNGLEPETGAVLWSYPFEVKAGMTIPTPRAQGDRLYVTGFYCGSLMLEVAGGTRPRLLWKSDGRSERPDRTDKLHCVMNTPFWIDGTIYGIDSYGELRGLRADTGERLWTSLKATRTADTPADLPMSRYARWGHAFLIQNGERFFLFNELGDLIIAKLTPQGYEEIDRAHILAPTNPMAGRPTVWMHPAFANGRMYARNDKEIVCVELKK